MARCLAGAAGAGARTDAVRAARLLGAAEALRDGTGAWLQGVHGAEFDGHVAAVRSRLAEAAFRAARDDGRRSPIEEAERDAAMADAWTEGPRVP